MDTKDSDKDFTFSIEGKDYTISEKNDTSKNNTTKDSKKQTLHCLLYTSPSPRD